MKRWENVGLINIKDKLVYILYIIIVIIFI